jgi:glycerate kinase
MRILIAPATFKGSLDAVQVARNITLGMQRASPEFMMRELPLADGGSGTVAALTTAYKGEQITCRVCGPLGESVKAIYGWVPQKRLAIIELAQAAGLALVPPAKRNPCVATTQGFGELIADAAARGCTKMIMGVGDSATIDCGLGALSVLGIRFLDEERNEVEHDCRGMINLGRIDDSQCLQRVKEMKITIAADVMNKLTGKQGALVYARQKGATPETILHIRRALMNFKKVVRKQYKIDVDTIPGAGAAGGVPAAFRVILNADVRQGFDLVAEAVNLHKHIANSDLIITGEGRIDAQSFYGKVVANVIHIAHEKRTPVILVTGSVEKDARISEMRSVVRCYSLLESGTSLTDAIKNAPRLLQETACMIGKDLLRS